MRRIGCFVHCNGFLIQLTNCTEPSGPAHR